jgi:hypothetical protein
MLAVLLISSAAPAQAGPQKEEAPETYTVIATPDEVTLCPGQSKQIAVRLTRQVTRTVRGRQVVGRPRDVRAGFDAVSSNPSIATLQSNRGSSVPLQLAGGGRSSHIGAWFTVFAGLPGTSEILFTPNPSLFPLGYPPIESVLVEVKCQFKVTLDAFWIVTGHEITHKTGFTIPDVMLKPDANGNFSVDVPVDPHVVRSGDCGGADTASGTTAHFNGSVDARGLLQIDVTFDAIAHTGSEGCHGLSKPGSAQAQPLSFLADVSTGQRSFYLNRPHVLVDDAGSFTGPTYLYINVLQQ